MKWTMTTIAVACAVVLLIAATPTAKPRIVEASTTQPRMIAGAGRIEPASEEIQVGADLYGRIRDVLVEEGQAVRRGQPLAALVNDDYHARVSMAATSVQIREAALERLVNGSRSEQRLEAEASLMEAEAVMANARQELSRKAQLHEQKLIARMELESCEREFRVSEARFAAAKQRLSIVREETRPEDLKRARAELDQARAQLAEATAMLDKTIVRSPIDGIVLRKKMKSGESITALSNQPIVTIGDCSRLRVRMDVDETDVAKVEVGQSAWVRADAYGDSRFQGKVICIGRMLGRKNVRTDEPAEKSDVKVLETMIELDPQVKLPVGLRVDAYINPRVR
jgi:HlyD family secretion protein